MTVRLSFALILAAMPGFSQTRTEPVAVQPLSVSAEQVTTASCTDQPYRYTVYVKVRVTYTNISKRLIILRKDKVDIWTVRVASSLADAHKKRLPTPRIL